MSGGKWTPGPWRVDPRYPSDIQTANGKVEICTIDADGASGNVRHRLATPSGPTPVANARLIAAAPEMAEALAATLGLLRQAQDMLTTYLHPDSAQDPHETMSELLLLLDGPEQRAIENPARALLARINGEV